MKMKLLLTLAAIFAAKVSLAQYPVDMKYDYTWVLGYATSATPYYGNSILSFNGSNFDTSYRNAGIWFYLQSASISDTAGKLAMMSNGFAIYDSSFNIINNCDSLNCCNNVFYNNYNKGYANIDGHIIIKPSVTDNRYLLLNKRSEIINQKFFSYGLLWTVIDATPGNQHCSLREQKPKTDTLSAIGHMEACRHANGRDWWVLQFNYRRTKYYSYLVEPTQVILKDSGSISGYIPVFFTQSVYSPDGSKFIVAGMYDTFGLDSLFIAMFDFDRCTGKLSNPQYYYWKSDSTVSSSGCAVSPNSRYLYVSTTLELFQFDLQAPNWAATKTLVAAYDNFADTLLSGPWGTYFTFMRLAPDNKIYFGAGATRYLHTIDNPDEPGLACNVNQHSFKLPSINLRAVGNFPNYRLGPIDGSPCDTLGIDIVNNIEEKLDNNTEPVRLYPNPATDYITLFIPRITKQWQFALFDIQGREVLHIKSRGAFRSVDVSQLATGLYLWKLVYEDGKRENGKLVIQR